MSIKPKTIDAEAVKEYVELSLARIDRLEKVLSKTIAWLQNELGAHSVNSLLSELHEDIEIVLKDKGLPKDY